MVRLMDEPTIRMIAFIRRWMSCEERWRTCWLGCRRIPREWRAVLVRLEQHISRLESNKRGMEGQLKQDELTMLCG
jgi:hypothetical protein